MRVDPEDGRCLGVTASPARERYEGPSEQVQDRIRALENEFEFIQCRQLIGFNLLGLEERQKYRQRPLRPMCRGFIACVVDHGRAGVKAFGEEKK